VTKGRPAYASKAGIQSHTSAASTTVVEHSLDGHQLLQAARKSAGAVIGGLLLGWPLDFTLLPFDHYQRKISGEKSVRLLTEKRYSPYRPVSAIDHRGLSGSSVSVADCRAGFGDSS